MRLRYNTTNIAQIRHEAIPSKTLLHSIGKDTYETLPLASISGISTPPIVRHWSSTITTRSTMTSYHYGRFRQKIFVLVHGKWFPIRGMKYLGLLFDRALLQSKRTSYQPTGGCLREWLFS